MSTLSLTGKNNSNKINLYGKEETKTIPTEINNLKIKILNDLIIPFISKQWKVLEENLLFIDKTKHNINYYYNTYKLNDLLLYKEIIRAFELVINEHEQLVDLEKKMYGKDDNFSTLFHKTPMIKLKPEYEIYDSIIGKPKRKLNEKYNEEIIDFIQKLLLKDNITFNKIKELLKKQFNII